MYLKNFGLREVIKKPIAGAYSLQEIAAKKNYTWLTMET